MFVGAQRLRNVLIYSIHCYFRNVPVSPFKSENCVSPNLINKSVPTRTKGTIDRSRLPTISEDDLEEQFVKGSGPGGQSVNKTVNCVVLTHKPTGIVIKCHFSRLLHENRKIARELMITKLDNVVNGENSIEAQRKRKEMHRSVKKLQKRKKLEEMKAKWETDNSLEG